MKKTNIISAIFIALLVGVLPSCKKEFLELTPKVSLLEDNFYKTEKDAFLALAAVYNTLTVQPWECVPVMADLRSDDTFTGGDASGSDMIQYQEQERYKIDPENAAVSALWNRCYSGIYRANIFLAKADGIEWKNLDLKKRMIAEAKYLRGYFYWDLVRHYGWVSILTTVASDVEVLKTIPQNTPQEVYNQIAKDLLAAYADLPKTATATETGRATRYITGALLSRIYMYYSGVKTSIPGLGLTGTFGDGTTTIDKTWALAALKEIINSNAFALLTSYNDVFATGNQNNKECISSFQYSKDGGSGDWGGWGVTGNFAVVMQGPRDPAGDPSIGAGWSFGVITFSLANEFENGDVRKETTVYDAGAKLTGYTRGYCNTGYFNKKYLTYLNAQGTKGEPAHNYGINYIDIRYADVLLMAAELDMTANVAYFNQVRTRAGLSAKNPITLDDIKHERRAEFGGEGLRYWDLLRWGMDYAATQIAASWTGIPTDNKMVNVADFVARPFTANSYGMYPIPASEIRNSGNFVQQFIPAYK